MNNSIQTVFFDFDGTLAFHKPDSFDVVSAFCADIGQPLDAETTRHGRRALHQYFLDPDIREQLTGFSAGEFWQHFNRYALAAAGIEGDLDRLAAEVTDHFTSIELVQECPDDGCDTLVELRARGYGLGLITNREHVQRFYELLDQMELRAHFDVILASGEVGISKPDPGIFHAAIEKAGTTAEASLYVGDNYWADVVGARRAGVTPALYDPHRIFTEADCLILDRITDLLAWLP